MAEHRIYSMLFSKIYPMYVNKVEKKGRSKEELDEALCWVTGYSPEALHEQLDKEPTCREFIDEAPLNPDRKLITGVVCGVRVEEVEEPLMQELRYLDKVVDELARGKKMENILRKP